jgi:peptide/nickel transport system permease protein
MLEVLDSDYVRFARLRGLSHWRVTWKHALKNALIPVITFAGIMLGALLNGSIVVEQVFAWPGIGRVTLQAVTQRDFPMLQGAVLFAGFFYVVAALIVDILYAYVDPRMRFRADAGRTAASH